MTLAAPASPPDPRTRRRRAAAAGFLALFAASQALLWWAYWGNGAKRLIGDENTYQAWALSILDGGAWIQSSIWPPLQPLLLASLYSLAGPHVLVVQLFQTALFVACGGLLRDLWRHLGGSVAAANTAAALFLLNPATAAYAHWLWPEVPHLFLLLAALCLLVRATQPVRALLAGACVGLAMLAKSLLSAFWPFLLLAFVQRGRPRFAGRAALAFVLALAAVTAPALWHGWRETGRPMIADSSVYNLWVGLTDRWRSDYVQDMGGATLPAFLASGATPQERNAIYLDKVRALVAERGPFRILADQWGRQYFRLFSAKTSLVSQLPGPACAGYLSVYRTPAWLAGALMLANAAFHAVILAAAAFGIACWRRRPDRLALLAALFLAYQLALFLLIHVKARFLLPMLPFLCGLAGSFLAMLGSRIHGAVGESALATTAPRLALGAVLAALLLFLAFGGPVLDHPCAG
ncbi:glycosyltransferase family 39 protein [Dokdonella sp.]|uniref:glycosyltransferase family 39 protein n=1 Tax=Dokdonella sp. TaxID=2291710 RepID=UPI00260391EE|nr:glycosyltransferase family 39 protein [Dokdonella sp.]